MVGSNDRATLQLGVGFRNDAHHVSGLDDRESLEAQCRQQLLVGLLLGDGPLGDQRQGALDARIDDEGAARVLADRPHDGVDVGVDEVQHHAVGRSASFGWLPIVRGLP